MTLILRLIAVVQGLSGLAALLMTLLVLVGDRLPQNGRGWVALTLLAAWAPLGLFSAVQLFRLRESGRRAALAVIVVIVLFGFAQYRKAPELTGGTVFKLILSVAMIGALLSERAQRLCANREAESSPPHEQQPTAHATRVEDES